MQYDVLLTRHQNNGYTARPLLWPEIVATGDSEEEVLVNVQLMMADLPVDDNESQTESKIVQVIVAESAQSEDLEFADQDRKMAQEEVAYQNMLPMLREKYLGQFVAIFQGKLIDHDREALTLFDRIHKQYPDEVVLMTKVYPGAEPIFMVRSPKLVEDTP